MNKDFITVILTNLKVSDRPDDWQKDCSAANEIYQHKQFLPSLVV